MTEIQCDALASRIAAMLRERQEVGAARRRLEHEYQRRNSERALARYRSLTMRRSDNANGASIRTSPMVHPPDEGNRRGL